MTDPESSLPSAERWSLLEPLLDDALAREPNERPAYLDTVCKGDASLRAELTRLLAVHERVEHDAQYLERPAPVRFASLWDEQFDDGPFRAAIDARYHVDGELGQGGMAVVYRARDRRDGRAVALKVLRPTTSAGGAARFRREIALAAELRHPRIVPLLESGEIGGRLWYAMPLVGGESLGARIRREGRLPVTDAVRLLREMAEGLAYAHARGVIHRDLKPDNVLLADGHAVIADFGVAKAVFAATHAEAVVSRDDVRTATGVGVGTPAYMSPEQAVGERNVDHRTDLYALGAVAYELLSAVTPFSGRSRQALVTAILADRPASLSAHRRDVPPALDALVMRLLAKQAAERPASADEVGDALTAIAALVDRDESAGSKRGWLASVLPRLRG